MINNGLLVLTRKKGESVIVNGNVKVKVLGVNSGQIKFGIDAPKDVIILRSEIK